jgi:hypothetical protein
MAIQKITANDIKTEIHHIIEAKGGNQIGGKLRKATAKTYSYGDTIEFASGDIKKKADETKGKLES